MVNLSYNLGVVCVLIRNLYFFLKYEDGKDKKQIYDYYVYFFCKNNFEFIVDFFVQYFFQKNFGDKFFLLIGVIENLIFFICSNDFC